MDRDERWELFQPHRPDQDLPGLEAMRRELNDSPDLQERLREIQEADRWIGREMKSVSIPAALRATVDQSIRAVEQADQRRRRRRWFGAGMGAAAAAALFLAAMVSPGWGDLTVDSAAPECVRLFQQLGDVARDAEDWGADSDWPVGFYTNYFRGRGVVDVLGHSCSAYVFSKDRCRAMAVMIPRRAFAWRSRPSESIVSSSGGVAVAFYPSGDFVCVVVVDGDAKNLGFFRDEKVVT